MKGNAHWICDGAAGQYLDFCFTRVTQINVAHQWIHTDVRMFGHVCLILTKGHIAVAHMLSIIFQSS